MFHVKHGARVAPAAGIEPMTGEGLAQCIAYGAPLVDQRLRRVRQSGPNGLGRRRKKGLAEALSERDELIIACMDDLIFGETPDHTVADFHLTNGLGRASKGVEEQHPGLGSSHDTAALETSKEGEKIGSVIRVTDDVLREIELERHRPIITQGLLL